MFERLRALFTRPRAPAPVLSPRPLQPCPPARYGAPSSAVRTAAPGARHDDDRRSSDDDAVGRSYAAGYATNSTALGVLVGGSAAGAVLGDLARDGVIGEACSSRDDGAGASWDSGSSWGGD